MNKSIIALAVAGLMAAPMAAQADATVYGKVHASIDFMSYDDATPVTAGGTDDATVLASNSSRIGFKGSEDLGGGLKAIWKLESGLDLDEGDGTFSMRNRYVGLNGGWGTLLGGVHDTPMKTIGRKVELFPEYLGDFRNVTTGWDARVPNVVVYQAPTFGNGFSFDLAYTFDWQGASGGAPVLNEAEGNTDNNDYTALSASIDWTSGNWYLALAYEDHDVPASTLLPPAPGTPLGTDYSEDSIRAVAKWTPGAWMLTAFYQTVGGVTSAEDFDVMGIGAGYKMGKNMIKAQYYMNSGEGSENDATLMAVGWDYKMSKRTTAYIAYAATDNDLNTNYAVNKGGHGDSYTPGGGEDPSGFSIGVIHDF